jgi:hypothetical protein
MAAILFSRVASARGARALVGTNPKYCTSGERTDSFGRSFGYPSFRNAKDFFFARVFCYHCSEYSLEVVCPSNPESQPLAKFALNPYPIHHPDGLDLAVVTLRKMNHSLVKV